MLANKAELGINLASLKRHDPYISEIVDCSTHVALYRYLISEQVSEWEKTEVEGAMFIYRRMAPPFYGFTILNRLSMDNMAESLSTDLEFQTQNPFLLYKNARGVIYGIWFFDDDHCTRIGGLLTRLCSEGSPKKEDNSSPIMHSLPHSIQSKNVSPPITIMNQMTTYNRPPPNNNTYQDNKLKQSSANGVDILQLLSKARDKFEKNQNILDINPPSVNSTVNNGGNNNQHQQPPQMQPYTTEPLKPQPRKIALSSLFNKTKNDRNELSSPIQKSEPIMNPQQLQMSLPLLTMPHFHSLPTVNKPPTPSSLTLQANKLISPEDFERSTPVKSLSEVKPATPIPPPITENQLKKCLIHLIETDTEFLSTIHKAYISSLH